MAIEKLTPNQNLIRSIEDRKPQAGKSFILIFIVLLVLGVGTGYLFSKSKTLSSAIPGKSSSTSSSSEIKKGETYGSQDEKTFADQAEGKMQTGGIEGEGAYHLERPGGDSQNVYLTSSSVDLSKFVGRKVKVWGQTNQAKKAGWLMDVGRLQVIE